MSPYVYNSSNQLTSTPAATFTYDGNGNTLTKTDSTGTTQYTWDFENRLSSAVLPGSAGTVTFRYDPFGRRIQKNSSGGGANYLYDGANSIEELDQIGVQSARYTQGPVIDEPLAQARNGSVVFYQQDGLRSATSLSDSAGALSNTYVYGSFGVLTASTGTLASPFQYTGRNYDPETGLRYYRARYYDSNSGRFLTEDPIRFDGSINFYPYAANHPTDYIDPFGLQHSPGGPWHPEPWIQFGCLGSDDCATLSWKITMFKRVIAAHAAWDIANGTNRHALEIADYESGLAWCITLHQRKCTNRCPKFIPVPQPESVPEPNSRPIASPQTVGVAAGLATAGVILYWIISEGSRILFPPRDLIPIL